MRFASASKRMIDETINELLEIESRIKTLNPPNLLEKTTHREYIERIRQDYERWGAIDSGDWHHLIEHIKHQRQWERELLTAQITNLSQQLEADGKVPVLGMMLPTDLFNNLKQAADERGISIEDLLRKFLKLGMLAVWVEQTDDAALVLKHGDTEKELLLI